VDDLRLLERMRAGDEQAFVDLFARHRAAVYRYALHMAGAAAADDIVQEVFLALLQQLDRYDAARASLQSYLLGIAKRQALRRFASPPTDQWPDDDRAVAGSSDGDPFDALSRAEIAGRVRAAIATLPPVYREAVVLCDLNEVDYATAARVMTCPVGTVRSRLHRARALLVERLTTTYRGPTVRVHGE
jgi:RNA polymerase sigma-70 factor, ECF subfamily